MSSEPLVLYDLVGKENLRFSPYCLRARLAIAHKQLPVKVVLRTHNDARMRQLTGQVKVPVLVDGRKVIIGSWQIACHLDDEYPLRPSLMHGWQGRALAKFFNSWVDQEIDVPILRSVLLDVLHCLHPSVDACEFRKAREERFGKTFEEMHSNREQEAESLRQALNPVRNVLKQHEWISGSEVGYADYVLFGSLQFPRYVTEFQFLMRDDDILEWEDRMSRLFGCFDA